MAIKTIYIHPGDMLDIRLVYDVDEKPNKAAWDVQSYNQQQRLLLTIHDSREVGYCDYGTNFRLNNIDGTLRRWLA
jgi:hypothetical protein